MARRGLGVEILEWGQFQEFGWLKWMPKEDIAKQAAPSFVIQEQDSGNKGAKSTNCPFIAPRANKERNIRMSKRIQLSRNPSNYPNSFSVVPHNQVRAGDIYQGTRDPSKWYANTEGQNCVDLGRTYYRPLAGHRVDVQEAPRRRMSHARIGGVGIAAAGAAEQVREFEDDDEGDDIPLVTVSVSRAGLAALVAALQQRD